MLEKGNRVALVANSDPNENPQEVAQLEDILKKFGLSVEVSPLLYDQSTGNFREKARVTNAYFADPTIKAIFDISGGDRANSVLPYLDYATIKKSVATFFGYSDLSTVVNSIYAKTGRNTELFQLRTLLWESAQKQQQDFYATYFEGKGNLYPDDWRFVQGSTITGTLIGGNIRCFLKLAGTNYRPDFTGKVLFLESLGGAENALFAAFHQLRQLPDFEQLQGILLGTFTTYDKNFGRPVEDLLLDVLDLAIPVARTKQVGHAGDSRALAIGMPVQIEKVF